MKKILALSSLLLLASCNTWEINTEVNTDINDAAPDVKNLWVQACPSKDESCKQIMCNKEKWVFICSDMLDAPDTCSEEKSFDDILNKYKVCSSSTELLKYAIFNYSESKNEFFETMTPAEIENKINEELAKIESGWNSEWLGTFLASAWWALIGWLIADKLFGSSNAQMPASKPWTENSRNINKNSLEETKKDVKSETEARNQKREAEKQKAKSSVKKRSSSSNSKSTSKRKRR